MGPFELLILLFVVFLVLGPKRITALFRSLGRGAQDFTDELSRDKTGDKDNRELTEEEDEPQRKE
jgi:sec-independent protein translocase protein TatA